LAVRGVGRKASAAAARLTSPPRRVVIFGALLIFLAVQRCGSAR
jgi:hypothetical protein